METRDKGRARIVMIDNLKLLGVRPFVLRMLRWVEVVRKGTSARRG